MRTTLLIMAAGIGSRFGTGIKQLAKVGPTNEIIMDYSVHDAIRAGFDKIVFVIRKDIEDEFREVIGGRIEKVCAANGVEVAYAFQSISDIPGAFPEGRTKPWGTGQAVLAAKKELDSPFVIINADDYYGADAYRLMREELLHGSSYCMAGFALKNTLSENGAVTRGICRMKDGYLTEVEETRGITKTAQGAEADGRVLDMESLVSMNMWGLRPDFLPLLEQGFCEFFEEEVPKNPLEAEFLIPIFIGRKLKEGKLSVKVLKTGNIWYGMTYKEDVAPVQAAFQNLIREGKYKEDLYSDL